MSWPEVLAQMLMADAPAGTGGSAESVMFLVCSVELNVGNNGKENGNYNDMLGIMLRYYTYWFLVGNI